MKWEVRRDVHLKSIDLFRPRANAGTVEACLILVGSSLQSHIASEKNDFI